MSAKPGFHSLSGVCDDTTIRWIDEQTSENPEAYKEEKLITSNIILSLLSLDKYFPRSKALHNQTSRNFSFLSL
jgi:hypothetical protein